MPALDGARPQWVHRVPRPAPAPDPLRGDPAAPEVTALVTAIRRGDTTPRTGITLTRGA
jgi:hypothetical protein